MSGYSSLLIGNDLMFLSHRYFAACVAQSWPYSHPLCIAWMSENTGSVGKNTIASGAIIGFANIYGGGPRLHLALKPVLMNHSLGKPDLPSE